ncbi:hypothetical protein DPMN_069690 [Dreissena polymorpha]|uniref:Uncharacterized protein n=1 Tax=Dreissena polymorpha TaxID=45954 RepID=A0A9D3Z4T4_DREPO|nr:hypothetical protein DPMN_069690 [Dreissena polymorpha]
MRQCRLTVQTDSADWSKATLPTYETVQAGLKLSLHYQLALSHKWANGQGDKSHKWANGQSSFRPTSLHSLISGRMGKWTNGQRSFRPVCTVSYVDKWANGQNQSALSHNWTTGQVGKNSLHYQHALSHMWANGQRSFRPACTTSLNCLKNEQADKVDKTSLHCLISGQMDKVASDQPALSHKWTSFNPAWVDLDLDLLVDGEAATVREHLDRHARYVLCIIDATAI